jgi:hypothetical protein
MHERARVLAVSDPQWAAGRPRLISDACWSLRKLAAYLASSTTRAMRIGRERLRRS